MSGDGLVRVNWPGIEARRRISELAEEATPDGPSWTPTKDSMPRETVGLRADRMDVWFQWTDPLSEALIWPVTLTRVSRPIELAQRMSTLTRGSWPSHWNSSREPSGDLSAAFTAPDENKFKIFQNLN